LSESAPVRHSLTTRLLHLLLAAAILCQLADSQLMRVPRPGRPTPVGLEAAAFSVHEYVGLASLAIVVLFWLWLLLRRAETDPGALFPWLSARRPAASPSCATTSPSTCAASGSSGCPTPTARRRSPP